MCVNNGCYLYAFYSRLDQFQIPYKTLAVHRILFVRIAARKLKRKDKACWAGCQYAGNAVSMLGMLLDMPSVCYLDILHWACYQ